MGIFNANVEIEARIINDYDQLTKVVAGFRAANMTTVVTIGTFDLTHVGHLRYLREASKLGHLLIVGVDSDQTVKRYKGPLRPCVPEHERQETILHSGYVDFATLIDDLDEHGNWGYGLLKAVHPDVYVAVEDSYPEEQQNEIAEYCGKLVVLPRQAETSTSAAIHRTVLAQTTPLMERIRALITEFETGTQK